MSLLENLRKRKRAVAAITLPLLATIWFGTPASACLGMAVDSFDLPPADAAPATHDHSAAHDHAAPPAHDHSATHDHAAHDGHTHSADAARHAHGAPSHSHGACPHCPASLGGSSPDSSSTHVVCALLDDVSDSGAQTTSQKSALEHFSPPAEPIYVSPLERPISAVRVSPIAGPAYVSVALNLRHCVFLI